MVRNSALLVNLEQRQKINILEDLFSNRDKAKQGKFAVSQHMLETKCRLANSLDSV